MGLLMQAGKGTRHHKQERNMNNVHPIFKDALVSVMPKSHPAIHPRAYAVTIWIDGKPEEVNVVAFTTCDAICSAIDIFFDGEDPMPSDHLEIKAFPIDYLPRAA
jgi:hypothetical protein